MPNPSSTLGILALEGDIDLYQTPVVKGKLDELILQKTERILVDLSRVNYIDSSGLALFIEGLQRIGSYGGKLGIFGLQPSVAHIFEIARLDQVLHIYPDEATARAAL
ncbi:MAG: STAS domain-containing protein [Chthoniobacteraceae bacterium]